MPLSCSSLSAIACRNSGMPELGVYFVKPDSSAAIAAALMCSGVSKSGSPAPKLQTSSPSDFIAFALLSTDREREGVRLFARVESCIKPSQDYMCQPPISTKDLVCLFDPRGFVVVLVLVYGHSEPMEYQSCAPLGIASRVPGLAQHN